jgi:hypothetical protein
VDCLGSIIRHVFTLCIIIHWDSYPCGLGITVLDSLIKAIKNGTISEWRDKVIALKVVDDAVPPTAEDIQKLSPYTDLEVSSQSTSDWYCLLRKCQGSIESVLDSGYILNAVDDDGRPDFQQYAYIVNLDTDDIDFYDTYRDSRRSYPLTENTLTKLHAKWSKSYSACESESGSDQSGSDPDE